jgi:hypothetical protein
MPPTPKIETKFQRVCMHDDRRFEDPRKVRTGELSDTDARNEVACLEIEETFRFEQLMGNIHRYEPAFRVFTWAWDWAFGEETNEDEIPLAVQMRMWEEHELRKELGVRSHNGGRGMKTYLKRA